MKGKHLMGVAGAQLMLLGLLPACVTGAPGHNVQVVTTSNIVADWVRKIGNDRVEVFSLLPVGTDPHTFQPGAADVARVAGADMVFTVGLGLEGAWLSRLLDNAAADPARVVAVGENVDPLPGEEENDQAKEEGHGFFDPHFWWDPLRVKKAADEIARRLGQADSEGEHSYARNANAYKDELDGMDARISERLTLVPDARRKLVTSHETMNYFAARYGFEAVGSVFPGITTEREPTPAELAQLSSRIRELGAPAVFTETVVSDRLAQAVAAETGARIVRLYSDSLGPAGSGADTYIGMMDTNVGTIVQALR